ncbi:dATP/dGTP diphosphohydrolase domain-containing protein [Methylobacterium aquaticum]|nr:dATP/dGTP diphosphohydrolase domain-containing protein [Methylobacterium aquaticum]
MLRYNSGKHRLTLIPASLNRYTSAVLEYGAIKYSANNWRKGGSWTSAIDSLQRHLDAFREGEDFDAESALPHLAHLAFNVMILIEFFDKGFGTDDRFRYPGQPVGEQLPGRTLIFNQPPARAA